MNTLVEIIQRMRDKQYIHDFEVADHKIICKELNETYSPDELMIDRVYRYEGDSNPDDTAIAYGITSGSGTQGILLDAYGTYADPHISEVIKQIPVREIDENQV